MPALHNDDVTVTQCYRYCCCKK